MKTEVLKEICRHSELAVRVRGQCMAPLMNEGEVVTVSSRRFYLPGDVLLFGHVGGGLLVHRLIGYRLKNRSLEIITRGDGSEPFDAPVAIENVIGKVVSPRCNGSRLAGAKAWSRGVVSLGRLVVSRLRLSCSARST